MFLTGHFFHGTSFNEGTMENININTQDNGRTFYIACSGYLDSVIDAEGFYIARICRVQPLQHSSRYETLWFNCRVKEAKDQLLLKSLLPIIKEGGNVELHFTGKYKGTVEFQCSLTDEDPDHFLTLDVELDHVISYLKTSSEGVSDRITVYAN